MGPLTVAGPPPRCLNQASHRPENHVFRPGPRKAITRNYAADRGLVALLTALGYPLILGTFLYRERGLFMFVPTQLRRVAAAPVVIVVGAALALLIGSSYALANVSVTQVSTDPFTNTTSQHKTQVEPDTFTFGSTIVGAFQSGRFTDGGASDIGWATSTNGGSTWTHGFLPGITKFQGSGPFDRASDPAVAFDAKHSTWMIATLAITDTAGVIGAAVTDSRSTDGGLTWTNPVIVARASGRANLDKSWIVCDSNASSPHYGNCYAEYDDNGAGNRIHMATSSDGGATWTDVTTNSTGLGGQPTVLPNGDVQVPYESNVGTIRSFRSTNGGATWRSSVLVSSIQFHAVAGNLRTSPLPSAEVDAAGTVYVVWEDCRFQAGCTGNDIVMSKSTSETTWGAVTRVTSDGGDHFIPGIAVDKTTSGSTAKLGVAYYFYPNANCTVSTCQLDIGFVSSVNGGLSWSAATQVAGPMTLSWLAATTQGPMVGDYISTSINGGHAWPVLAIANAPAGGVFDESMNVPTGGLGSGLALRGGAIRASRTPKVTSGHQPARTVPATAR
jgi:hypothetical protein